MTKGERRDLRECIDLLFSEEGYTEAMTRLCRMAGMKWPAGELLMSGDLKSVDALEALRRTK